MKDKEPTLQEIIDAFYAKYPDGIVYDTDTVTELAIDDVNEYKGITTWAAKVFMNSK